MHLNFRYCLLFCPFQSEQAEVVMLLALVTSFQIFSSFIINQLSYFAAVLSEIPIQNLPQKITFFFCCRHTFVLLHSHSILAERIKERIKKNVCNRQTTVGF